MTYIRTDVQSVGSKALWNIIFFIYFIKRTRTCQIDFKLDLLGNL